MSVLRALDARLRGTAGDLPVAQLTAAHHRLRDAEAILRGARGHSPRQVGLARLARAAEHVEHAVRALRVAQEEIESYLAVLGMAAPADPPAGPAPGAATPVVRPRRAARAAVTAPAPAASWWTVRVDRLTAPDDDGPAAAPPPARSSPDLLATVVERVRAGDRAGLRAHLRVVPVPVGVGLAALAPDALRHLAARSLGRMPAATDLAGLRREVDKTLREVLPGADPRVTDLLLGRACRVPPAPGDSPAPHPADSAITGAVLVGALARGLERPPEVADLVAAGRPGDHAAGIGVDHRGRIPVTGGVRTATEETRHG
jgi:hypothetical protein